MSNDDEADWPFPDDERPLVVFVSHSGPDEGFARMLVDSVATKSIALSSRSQYEVTIQAEHQANFADLAIRHSDVVLVVFGLEIDAAQENEVSWARAWATRGLLKIIGIKSPRGSSEAVWGSDMFEGIRGFNIGPFGDTLTSEQVELIRDLLRPRDDEEERGPTARTINRRLERLDAEGASRLMGGAEALLAEAEHLLASPAALISEEDAGQLEQDIRIVRAALRSPKPDTVTVERGLARIAGALALVQPSTEELAAEIEFAGVDPADARSLAADISEVGRLFSSVGSESPEQDIAVAQAMLDALTRIDEKLETIAASTSETNGALTELGPKERIRDAKLNGRVKFWAELWPGEKARILGRLINTGIAISGGTTIIWLGVPTSIMRAANALLKVAFP